MPKIQKNKEKRQQREDMLKKLEIEKSIEKKYMFSSAFITLLIAIAFFVISFIFNGRFYEIPIPTPEIDASVIEEEAESSGISWLNVLDVGIKSFSVILFFLFMLISVGNYQELRGYIVKWKQLLFLIIISILQASTEIYVFLIAAIGITLIITYFYFIQGKLNAEIE
jgi:hypothetical protein